MVKCPHMAHSGRSSPSGFMTAFAANRETPLTPPQTSAWRQSRADHLPASPSREWPERVEARCSPPRSRPYRGSRRCRRWSPCRGRTRGELRFQRVQRTELSCQRTIHHCHLQIGNGRGGPFGSAFLHSSIIGWSVSKGQNLGERIACKQVEFQYSPALDRGFRSFTALATASMSPDSG